MRDRYADQDRRVGMALGAWPGPREGPVAGESHVVSILTVNTRDLCKLMVAGTMLRRHRLGDGSITSALRGRPPSSG